MQLLARVILFCAAVVTGCGSGDTEQPLVDDMSMTAPDDLSVRHCLAFACAASCPDQSSYCVASDATSPVGVCTSGQSTCGMPLTGDCGFTDRCLSPTVLGKLFVAVPEGGCGVQRVACANGCADGDADGGVAAHCR